MEWLLLSSLDEDERQAVVDVARRASYRRDDVIFHEGSPSDSMHLVVSGHVAVTVSTPDGKRATLNVLGPGAWFGELSLLRDQVPAPRSATVIALDEVETTLLTRSAFQQLRDQHPEVERVVGVLLAERVRALSYDLLHARYVGLDQRLCGCLLDLLPVYGGASDPVVVPLTQHQLADLVGGTRPSVNQVLQTLVAESIVEVGRGRVTVRDRDGLVRKAGR